MPETTSIHVRWPNPLALQLRELAARRHTTVSELMRMAVVERFFLQGDEPNSAKNGTNQITGGSL